PKWENNCLTFLYEGKDNLHRCLTVIFSESPENQDNTTAHYKITLQPKEKKSLQIAIGIAESSPTYHKLINIKELDKALHRSVKSWLGKHTEMLSSNTILNEIVQRSILDLRVLRSRLDNEEFFAAGTPWFATLFGRDSIISALQMLAFEPRMAEQTL